MHSRLSLCTPYPPKPLVPLTHSVTRGGVLDGEVGEVDVLVGAGWDVREVIAVGHLAGGRVHDLRRELRGRGASVEG